MEPVKADDPTIGKLVTDASRDISTLISKEIELAKSELKVSIKHGGTGIGLFAAAGFLALLAIIMLSVAFAYFVHMTGLDLAWCFLIVFAVYLLVAGVLGLVGVMMIKQVKALVRGQAQVIAGAMEWKKNSTFGMTAFLSYGFFWLTLVGLIVFPKSSTPERMAENFSLFDFELDDDAMKAISALDRGEDGRTGPNPDEFDYIPG